MCKRILKKQTNTVSGIPFYKIGTFGKEANAFISEEIYNEYKSKYSFPKKGDILLSASGTIGRRVIYDGMPAYFQDSNIVWIDNDEKKVLSEYLYLFYGFCDWNPSRGATISRLYNDDLRRIQIPIPPLTEQKQIVALLDQAFTAIDKAQANIETNINNAKELFQSKLNDIFSQTGEGWEERTLEKLISISHGFAFKSKDFITDFTGNTPIVLTPGNFSEDAELYFTHKNTKRCISDYPANYLFSQGELVVVMTDLSSKMKILGKPAVIDSNNILHNQRIGRITFNTDELLRDFLYYYFQSSQYLSNIKNTATGTMVRHTAPKRILANLILFPKSVKDQENIISQLSQLRVELEKTQLLYLDKLKNLEELKKSILQKAFNGELT